MHEPSAISAVSVHEKGVVIVLADDGVEKFTCEVDVADRWRQVRVSYISNTRGDIYAQILFPVYTTPTNKPSTLRSWGHSSAGRAAD